MELPPATQRVMAEAARLGLNVTPFVYPDGTKTSADAAAAVGAPISAIAKSMAMMVDEDPVIVLMSGDRRVDAGKLAGAHGGSNGRRATLDEVRRYTGFAAGGTPPIAHPAPLVIYADVSLQRNERVWVAGGTPTTVFEIELGELMRVTGATWVDVAE